MASSLSRFYGFKPLDKAGNPYDMAQYLGKVVLVVNVASKCGFTPQYDGLEKLYQKHKDEGLVILGFPCNGFGSQEPGSADEIQSFCRMNYGVTFPVLNKTEVNGDNAEPLYEWLKSEKSGLLGLKRIKWNFEKFLVGRDGSVVQRYASLTKPEAMEEDVVKELNKKPPSSANGAAEKTNGAATTSNGQPVAAL